jgi:hypothetical protein
MNNPAFIVDGFTELKIIQRLCPGKPVSRTDLNGKDVTLKAIAKRIASLIKLFGDRHYPIVILIDKEQRDIAFNEMAKQIGDELRNEHKLTNQDLRIGVADRMIENWIIADWETFAGEMESPKNMEGTNGTAEIKRIKGSYGKTTDGVKLFLQARQEKIYENSPSYKHFINQLVDIDCHHLKFDK